MAPMISVVMPTYNSEKYIGEAIESILAQTFTDFEFLIINEYGSDDSTVDIIKSFHDPRIIIIQNAKFLGIAASLNEGIRQSTGKYVARMDSDDRSLPRRFEKQVDFMETNNDIAVLGAWQTRFGLEKGTHKTAATHDEIKVNTLFRSDVCHSVVMLRKCSIVDNNLWYNEDFIIEDMELWSRAVHIVRFANLQEVLGLYRKHSQGVYDTRLNEIISEEQGIFAASLSRLHINYYNYPQNIMHAHLNRRILLNGVSVENWAGRLRQIGGFFNTIVTQNDKLNVYNHDLLKDSLMQYWLSALDINASIACEMRYDKLPFEYIIEDILSEAGSRAQERDICIFCLGKIGKRLLPYFKKYFDDRLKYVSDNDESKWGEKFDGTECVSPMALPTDICVFAATADFMIFKSVKEILDNIGISFVYLYSEY